MKGYVLAEVEVTDPTQYEAYRPLAAAAIAKYGGRYLVRGGAVESVEGDVPPQRLVLLEFDSPARARAWYHSPDYQAARALRERAARSRVLLLNGHDPG